MLLMCLDKLISNGDYMVMYPYDHGSHSGQIFQVIEIFITSTKFLSDLSNSFFHTRKHPFSYTHKLTSVCGYNA